MLTTLTSASETHITIPYNTEAYKASQAYELFITSYRVIKYSWLVGLRGIEVSRQEINHGKGCEERTTRHTATLYYTDYSTLYINEVIIMFEDLIKNTKIKIKIAKTVFEENQDKLEKLEELKRSKRFIFKK